MTDPPPALLTLIDAERMALEDSELIPDSAKAAIRSYLGELADSAWLQVSNPYMARIVGECSGLTAILDPAALPEGDRTGRVLIDVPGIGFAEFRLARVRSEDGADTWTGQARQGAVSILLKRDSIFAGRITTLNGVFDFRSGRYGLIEVDAADTSRTLPRLHLLPEEPLRRADAEESAAVEVAAPPDADASAVKPVSAVLEVSAADTYPTVADDGAAC